jgi:hypothetical protein
MMAGAAMTLDTENRCRHLEADCRILCHWAPPFYSLSLFRFTLQEKQRG